ncbi:MAG: hypothetical protein JWP65_561 [Ramlibacter sp.]|jgi:hypothetical protein|uniref:hypothetical protein n=1 Tax=Ramlibacter sp. TaxID=1917967 RepID=UPI0026213AA2|nr:hypothetical protein [Ramlibacter sp.]MDB5750140.1 hypothetical protein [Ramlibacter sp.]
MNEVSGAQRSPTMLPASLRAMLAAPPPTAATELQAHEVAFRCLRGAHEISQIQHLRNQIALPASAVGDAGFAMREKKETKSAWSALSCATASTSVPSATFP